MAANCMYGCSFVSTRIGLTYLLFELQNPLEIEQFQFSADKILYQNNSIYIKKRLHFLKAKAVNNCLK